MFVLRCERAADRDRQRDRQAETRRGRQAGRQAASGARIPVRKTLSIIGPDRHGETPAPLSGPLRDTGEADRCKLPYLCRGMTSIGSIGGAASSGPTSGALV